MSNCVIVPIYFPSCGACIYWLGEKEVENHLVQYDMHSTGGCENPSSVEFGKILNGYHSCLTKKNY